VGLLFEDEARVVAAATPALPVVPSNDGEEGAAVVLFAAGATRSPTAAEAGGVEAALPIAPVTSGPSTPEPSWLALSDDDIRPTGDWPPTAAAANTAAAESPSRPNNETVDDDDALAALPVPDSGVSGPLQLCRTPVAGDAGTSSCAAMAFLRFTRRRS